MTSSSRIVLIHLLMFMLIVLMVDGSLQESSSAEGSKRSDLLTRRARYGDSPGVAIDVQYKNTPPRPTQGYMAYLDVALLSSGFVFVAVGFLVGMMRLSTRGKVAYETIV